MAKELPRRLGPVAAMGTLVGIMVGSGIYRVPSSVAGLVPSPIGFLLVWVAGGLLAIAGAMVFGELASMFPSTGGRYVYLREGVGPLPAFIYAWSNTIVLRPASHGAVALVFASYVGTLVPALAGRHREIAAVLILLLSAANYRSVLLSAGLTTITSGLKVLALGGIAVLILILAPTAAPAAAAAAAPMVPSWHGFGLALVTVMWTYSGWGSTTYITGEVRNAERTMPLVLAGGVAFVVLLFLLVNLAFLRALPLGDIAASKAIAADAAGSVLGETGRRFIAAVVLVSTFGSLNGVSLTSPRLPFAIGQDIPRLARLGAVHPVFATPHVAVVATTVLSVAALWTHSFEQLANIFILGGWPFYILCTVGLFRLRLRRPGLARAFRVPGYPVVPALFLVAATAMLANAAAGDPGKALLGVGLYLLGVPVFYLLRRGARPEAPPA